MKLLQREGINKPDTLQESYKIVGTFFPADEVQFELHTETNVLLSKTCNKTEEFQQAAFNCNHAERGYKK